MTDQTSTTALERFAELVNSQKDIDEIRAEATKWRSQLSLAEMLQEIMEDAKRNKKNQVSEQISLESLTKLCGDLLQAKPDLLKGIQTNRIPVQVIRKADEDMDQIVAFFKRQLDALNKKEIALLVALTLLWTPPNIPGLRSINTSLLGVFIPAASLIFDQLHKHRQKLKHD